MDKAKFSIDGDTSPENIVEGYSNGKKWNGWDVVTLPREQICKWLDASGYAYSFDESGDYPIVTIKFEDGDEVIESTPITFENEDGSVDILEGYLMDGYCFSKVE